MALTLGLESVKPAQQEQIYTLTDVLEAELECMDAQQALTDYINFNEILFSVRKHSSQECVNFAANLLGIDSVSLEAEANGDGSDAKAGFGDKLKAAWNKLLELIKRFWNWLKGVLTKFFKAVSDKAKSITAISLVSKPGMARLASQSEALGAEKGNIKIIADKIDSYSALVDKELTNKAEYTETDPIKQHLRMIEKIYGNIYMTATNIDAIFKANGPVTNRKSANQASVIATVNKSFNSLNKKVITFIRSETAIIFKSGITSFSVRRATDAQNTASYTESKARDIQNLDINKK